MQGLERAGLLAKGGTCHVAVMKVAHHGSARNNSRKLFAQVWADTYAFCADGQNGNPDRPTLVWLVNALQAQGRRATVAFTTLTATVEKVVRDYPPGEYGYTVAVMPAGMDVWAVG